VALKEPRADIPAAEAGEVLRRYQQEVEVYALLQKVGAPHIVPVYTVEPYDGTMLLSMAYMAGGDGDALIRSQPGGVDPARALALIRPVLAGLRAAHQHPMEIVHRDIKPSNLLLDAEGSAFLADFGLAQLAGMSGRSQVATARPHPGTPLYMAPEQESSTRSLTPAADVYAIGCVLFELLTGKRYRRVRPGTTASSLRAALPPALDSLLARCLAEDPFDRYEDAGALLKALEGVQLDAPSPMPAPTPVSAPAPVSVQSAAAAPARAEADDKAASNPTPTAPAPASPALAPVTAPVTASTPQPQRRVNWKWAGIATAVILVLGVALAATQLPGWLGAISTPPPATPSPPATVGGAFPTPTAPQATPTEPPAAATATLPAAAPQAAAEAVAVEAAGDPNATCSSTLTVWVTDELAPVVRTAAEQFYAGTGACIDVVPKAYGDIHDDFQSAGQNVTQSVTQSSARPDIVFGAHDWLGGMVGSEAVAVVSLGDKASNFEPEGVEACNYAGTLYCLPVLIENVALFINPDLVPEAPATWDEVKNLSLQLIDSGLKYGFLIQDGDPYHFYPIQTAFGGYVFGQDSAGNWDRGDIGVGNAGSTAAFQWLDQMYDAGALDRGENLTYEQVAAAFQNGDAAMIIGGPWMLADLRGAGAPYKVTPLPAGPEGQAKPFLSIQGFMISATSAYPELAQLFLEKYIATDANMAALVADSSIPRSSAWRNANVEMDEDRKAFAIAATGSDPVPNIPEMATVWGSLGEALTMISAGSATPEEAAAYAQTTVEQAVLGQ
jgi:maltose-binding protein MalE